MATLEIDGKAFLVDGDGFLTTPEVWTEEVARSFARYDGITEMNEKHWAVVKLIRYRTRITCTCLTLTSGNACRIRWRSA